MGVSRRTFLKQASLATAGTFALGGMPMRAMGKNSWLHRAAAAAAAACSDRVLILVQMHGGNDGLNTLIPLDQYALYSFLRPNIAIPSTGSRRYIPLDSTLPAAAQVGLHPDMTGFKYLYDQARAAVVQGVAYPDINQSHFRSRDIWFMGGGNDDYFDSGWLGRYLETRYPGYPDAYPSGAMPDPLAIEIGNGLSLAFHTGNPIPTSLSITNPPQFYDLYDQTLGVPGGTTVLANDASPPVSVEDTNYGEELQWIIEMEQKSDQYAERLRDVFIAGSNTPSIVYPTTYPLAAPASVKNNPLAPQLRLIARLLAGGCQTKVFLTRIGGFDTHASQVTDYDTTYGTHAALLYHISESMKVFMDDLRGLGLEDRVVCATFSEFGRRPEANGSYGTDHGTAAPMMLFGPSVVPGVIGNNPDLSNLDNGNLQMQHDYRQVFRTLLEDWLCASPSESSAASFDPTQSTPKLNLVNNSTLGVDQTFQSQRFQLFDCAPNPVTNAVDFRFRINRAGSVTLTLHTTGGVEVRRFLEDAFYEPGDHVVKANLGDLQAGTYVYKLEAGPLRVGKKLIKL